VAIDALLLRNAEKEIRGMIVGIQMACSFLAQFFFALVGGFLFDLVGPWTPFAILGTMDFLFVFTLLSMSYICKTFTNDIEERRLAKEEA
jgi:MFS family permease